MRKTVFLLPLALFTGLLLPGVASAQTACFDYNCEQPSAYACTFDASCSSASPYIWKYEVDYGDGTGSGLSGSPYHAHIYADPTYDATVSLTIYYFSGSGSTTATCHIDIELPPLAPNPPTPPTVGRCTN